MLAFCLLCGCFSDCSSEQDVQGTTFYHPTFFESLDDIRACYEILSQDEETVKEFLRDNGFMKTPFGIYSKAALQDLLTKLEDYKIPYPTGDSAYCLRGVSFYTGYNLLTFYYYNKEIPSFRTRVTCCDTVFGPALSKGCEPLAEDEIVATLTFGGKKVSLIKGTIQYSYQYIRNACR